MKPSIYKLEEGAGLGYVKPVLKILPFLNIFKGPWIAGGAARRIYEGKSLLDADIDVFVANNVQLNVVKAALTQNGKLIHESRAALSYLVPIDGFEYRIQVIKRKNYDSPVELLSDFDFTVCQLATDGEFMVHGRKALADIDNRHLAFAEDGRVAPVNLAKRAIKYFLYGFQPEEGLLQTIVEESLPYVTLSKIEDVSYEASTLSLESWVASGQRY